MEAHDDMWTYDTFSKSPSGWSRSWYRPAQSQPTPSTCTPGDEGTGDHSRGDPRAAGPKWSEKELNYLSQLKDIVLLSFSRHEGKLMHLRQPPALKIRIKAVSQAVNSSLKSHCTCPTYMGHTSCSAKKWGQMLIEVGLSSASRIHQACHANLELQLCTWLSLIRWYLRAAFCLIFYILP